MVSSHIGWILVCHSEQNRDISEDILLWQAPMVFKFKLIPQNVDNHDIPSLEAVIRLVLIYYICDKTIGMRVQNITKNQYKP